MAPLVEQASDALQAYLDKDLTLVIEQYDKLWEVEDDEETPYKSKYAARSLLETAQKEIGKLVAAAEGDVADRGREMEARILLFLGKNYYVCEEVASAERLLNRALERYLRSPLRHTPEHFVQIQDAFNQLGMLWCNRQGHSQGMNYLRRAQIMFERRPQAVREAVEQRACDNYTLTMFYLAQAYGALRKPGLSARFCAETMSQQLEHNTSGKRSKETKDRDPFDCKDWVRNCCSLSDFFVNEAMFWTAEYLLHSAAIMCERSDEICGMRPDNVDELTAECKRDLGNFYSVRLKFAKNCTQHPQFGEEVWRGERRARPQASEPSEGSRLSFQTVAAPKRGEEDVVSPLPEGPIVWEDGAFPEVVHLEDEEAADSFLSEETESNNALFSAGEANEHKKSVGWLEYGCNERVRLPVYFQALHGLVERRIQKANRGFLAVRGDPPPVEVPEDGEPEEEPLRWPSCVGASAAAARELFKLANHYQIIALDYYLMDGWVTEHLRILQELSQMYRTLIFWEKDKKRIAAMSQRRLRMLTPLVDILNPKVYLAYCRQISFEVAEIYQQLYELKCHGKLPEKKEVAAEGDPDLELERRFEVNAASRMNALAQNSLRYYSIFVESYHAEGKVPEKIDDDNTRAYLTARLHRAQLRGKMIGLGRQDTITAFKLALQDYEWILDYGRRHPHIATHPDISMAVEIRLCQEMVRMLPSKLSRLAAGQNI